jgi:23S rRNA (cytosine1962-C5)-methyltransferase
MVALMLDVILDRGRERSVQRRHPWLMSGAVARISGDDSPGALARVLSNDGEVLGYGHYSPQSSLRVRMLAFGKEPVDEAELLAGAIARAFEQRTPELCGDTDGVRLVNAEGDGLPGLVVDRYDDVLVVRVTSVGMHRARPLWSAALRASTGASSALERVEASAARREGFSARGGPLWGEPPERVVLRERDREYVVDLQRGQRTGFYLDQRTARDRVQALAHGRRVLDLFCYSGGFSVAALRGGASAVTAVDSSESALRLARENLERNGAALVPRVLRADAFEFVRGCEELFDLIVIDPPPLARTRRDVAKATRAYKDVALHALRQAAPGAFVLVFTGSPHVESELFRKVVFGASLDAGRSLQVLEEFGAAPDHPVALDHPEGRTLAGLLTRVVPER